MAARKAGLIALFDGTLRAPRKESTPQMLKFMQELRKDSLSLTILLTYKLLLLEFLEVLTLSRYHDNLAIQVLHQIIRAHVSSSVSEISRIQKWHVNVSPIGRNCSREERDEFEKYDKVQKIRETMVSVLREKFEHFNLTFSIGGQISFDGGNDHEIYKFERIVGHTVTSSEETLKQCSVLFLGKDNGSS
ncbi:hypothetical protein H5410_028267 [Solanum commersonii]|uniref:Phosphomannomutase n=1 Tax=Solanum commersonii TaxID=4109 RepID=A0A9J5Z4F7_SOLCO|nr:hypothetical protein H5410_028267 [Solanum commersonii]